MQEWSVILSVPVELELVVEAETVERAEAEALQWYRDSGHEAALSFAESVSYADAEVVDAWALKDEAEEEEE